MDFSPKANFAKGPNAQAWTNVASSPLFVEAAGVAMLELHTESGKAESFNDAAAKAFRMEGAKAFLWMLTNLTKPVEERKPVKVAQLRHDI